MQVKVDMTKKLNTTGLKDGAKNDELRYYSIVFLISIM
jgi:hypothetical protein